MSEPTLITCPVCAGQKKLRRIDVLPVNPFADMSSDAPKRDCVPAEFEVACTQCGGQGVCVSQDGNLSLYRGL